MAYTLTQNSRQAPLNQKQQRLFVTEGISDIIVRQNFEILNKELTKRLTKQLQPKANIVFGQAFATTGLTYTDDGVTTPGQLQVQIRTNGNPVRLKLAPFTSSSFVAGNYASFKLTTDAHLSTSSAFALNGGWLRSSEGVAQQIISNIFIESAISLSAGNTTHLTQYIPLPAFEMDDIVPSGLYTYQFWFALTTLFLATELEVRNLQVVAYELG